MPSELRHLLFRPPEVVQAIAEYRRRLGTPLPPGVVEACGPECNDAGGAVRFRIFFSRDHVGGDAVAPAAGKRNEELFIEGPHLAAALILYCKSRGIPLPANGDKSLQVFGEQVCLVATINPKQVKIPQDRVA